MKQMQKMVYPCILVTFIIILACSDKTTSVKENYDRGVQKQEKFKKATKKYISVINQTKNKPVPVGNKLKFSIDIIQEKPELDSLTVFIDGKKENTYSKLSKEITISTTGIKLGKRFIKISGYFSDLTRQDSYYDYLIISDIAPKLHKFKVINTYKHDEKAFTQGLVWDEGILYEGTGQWGKSSLRKIDLKRNEILQGRNLASDIFGEGICVLNDKIYQLTWRSNKGFVYRKDDFKLIQDFSYFTEGWGITTDGTNLIMSDGSNIIYYLNPSYFTEEKRVEVYDNKGPVNQLNELEYINNTIYANVYGDDYIVIIEPETGKVIGKVDCANLRPEGVPKDSDHVLNGIAYMPDEDHLLVTGKYWPVIHEIKLIE